MSRPSCVSGGDSRIFAPRSRRSPSVVVVALLLLRAGVESNPGPAAACVTGVLNCRSANHKIPVIHDLITDRNQDVLLLSETWFTSDTPQSILLDVAPAGYAALHVVRPTGTECIELIASALVSARLDYANSILFGCPQKHISRLLASTARTCQSRNAAGLSFFFID